MFEQSLIVDGAGKRSPWSFAISISVQSVLVAAALAVPLLHIAKLDPRLPEVLFLPRSIGVTESVKQAVAKNGSPSSLHILQVDKTYRPFQAPTRIPNHVATGPDLPGTPEYFTGANAPGFGDAAGTGIPGLLEMAESLPLPGPPPPPMRVAQPDPSVPVKVGGGVQASKLVFGPKPVYPVLAKQARISGSVRLAARISPDGRIRDLQVMSGHPMLVSAALEAVRNWIYKPTLLNGQPVEVLTDILVNFVLNQ